MKKIFRRSQMKDVIGSCIGGMRMHKYGMPYRNAGGHIFPKDQDLVLQALLAVELHPEIHLITCLKNGWTVNRYQVEDARVHYLYTGNPDPNIEFSQEHLISDWTEEELEAERQSLKEFRNRELTPKEIAAINFALNAILG